MTVPPTANGTAADLADLVEQLTTRLQAGEEIDSAAVVAEYPEHADRLAGLLPVLRAAAVLGGSGDGSGDPPANAELGDFRIVRQVGRGGMGIVYEAEQLSLRRRVALKVLPFASTMDPKQLQRFRNEALAAASLHHEHIVPVYAVGCERGVHYYAMQFIEGASLAQVIAGRASGRQPDVSSATKDHVGLTPRRSPDTAPIAALSTEPGAPQGREFYRRAAEMIADAADALEYAHGLGVVHRDIKPGNLLVDAAGKVWVADFGLARFGPDAGLTASGALLGTLRYMAPEQAMARHGLADHRVDVYGLGCTLYELLTGKPAVRGEDKADILRHIAFEEPIAPQKLDKHVPAELATVALKCLIRESADRYSTAGELAADLRRWLDDKPIEAKPPGWFELTAKWTRRHKALVRSAVAVTALAIVGLAIGMVRERGLAQQESQQRQRAQKNLRLAMEALGQSSGELVNSMITRPMARAPEEVATVKKLLAYYDEFIQANADDPALRLEVSNAYMHAGYLHMTVGDDARGAEEARKGLAIAEILVRENPSDRALARKYAANLGELALLLSGKSPEAEQLFAESIRTFDGLRQGRNDDIAGILAVTQNQLGMLLLNVQRPAEAEARFRIAVELHEGLLAEQLADVGTSGFLSAALCNLARTLHRTGRFDEADEVVRRAIGHQRESLRREPRDPTWRLALHSELDLLCLISRHRKRPVSEFEPAQAECIAVMERLVQDYPDFIEYRFELAKTLAAWAMTLGEARQFGRALPVRQRSVTILDAIGAGSPTNDRYRTFRDDSLWWLSVLERALGQEAPALATLGRIPEPNRHYADAAWMRALIRLTAQDHSIRNADEALHLTTWGTRQPRRPGASQGPAEWSLLLAVAQFRTGDAATAKATLDGLKNLPSDFDDILLYVRAMVHWRLGDKERALDYCRTAADRRRKQAPWPLLDAFHADALRETAMTEAELATPNNQNGRDN